MFFIWKDPGDTPADVEAKRDRLIARERRARTTNSFTSVGAATHACPLTSRCHESGIVLRYGPRESQRERAQDVAAWAYLIVAGLCEIGWPIGLKWTQQPGWTVLGAAMAVISLAISGGLLFLAQRDISLGTSYAVWTGIGAAGTFLVGVWFFGDPSSFGRWLGAALIIAGVITLKLAH